MSSVHFFGLCHATRGAERVVFTAAVLCADRAGFRTALQTALAQDGLTLNQIGDVRPAAEWAAHHPADDGADLIWHLHPERPVVLGPMRPAAPASHITAPLTTCRLRIEDAGPVTPLDAQFGKYPKKTLPDALHKMLFGQPAPTDAARAKSGADITPLRTYAVLEAAKMPYRLPGLLAATGLRHQSLFQGAAQEEFAEYAPYLVELTEHSDFTRRLFTADPKSNGLWDKDLGILLRSHADFDALRRHLRKFTHLPDDTHKKWFLRFWDNRIAADVLHAYFDDGLDRLFTEITCVITRNDDRIALLSCEGEPGQKPAVLTPQGRQRYLSLRQTRLCDQVTRHFLTLPDFAHAPPADLHRYVDEQVGRGRAAGLSTGADLFRYALGFCLAQDRNALAAAVAQHLSDAYATELDRRLAILSEVDKSAAQAQATAQATAAPP